MTQGYAKAMDTEVYGIPERGTTDYRAMALQFRYAITNSDALVMQFSHRRLGNSLITADEPDVALDWGFFQTRWNGNSIRIGKVPMPRGLFNEVRDVGTLFPFFRASKAFYSEGVETVDGISVSRSFDIGESGFSLDGSVYAGEFDVVVELSYTGGLEVIEDRLQDAFGIHGQLNTPIPGLRFSGDYLDANYSGSDRFSIVTASADYSQDRWFARGEWEAVRVTNSDDAAPAEEVVDYDAWYVQGGFGLTEQLWVNAQYEFNNNVFYNSLPSPPLPTADLVFDPNIKDMAIGLSYKFSPMFVVKGEYHIFEGYNVAGAFPWDLATGQPVDPTEADYFIISVSAAF
jgi:hypothetical protein